VVTLSLPTFKRRNELIKSFRDKDALIDQLTKQLIAHPELPITNNPSLVAHVYSMFSGPNAGEVDKEEAFQRETQEWIENARVTSRETKAMDFESMLGRTTDTFLSSDEKGSGTSSEYDENECEDDQLGIPNSEFFRWPHFSVYREMMYKFPSDERLDLPSILAENVIGPKEVKELFDVYFDFMNVSPFHYFSVPFD
jgi:hypothetical protein